MDELKYKQHFYSMVMSAIVCGLRHPVEWVANYERAIGQRYTDIPEIQEFCDQALRELFSCVHLRPAENKEEIELWFNAHYNQEKKSKK